MRPMTYLVAALLLCCGSLARAARIVQLNSAIQGKRVEFRIEGIPAVSNPFDPDIITVDATFTPPTPLPGITVPGFWYQGYTRSLSNGYENLTALGSPQWRIRYTPPVAGSYQMTVAISIADQPAIPPVTATFTAAASKSAGYVHVAANGRSFQTDAGTPVLLVGHDVCWYDAPGTYDYDTWFSRMHQAGENYTRLWMCPWAFGLECFSDSLTRYHLDMAWKLDHVFQLADRLGIRLMLCLDYHGMFETKPDYWGGNNFWPENPYNAANGGPCATQDDFFTSPQAMAIYQKRLRYLFARYGYSMSLIAWELFNEIDNVYQYLNPTDVANWHATMGQWLHDHDPYHHLVTTSYSDAASHPEIWSLSQIDYTQAHAYSWTQPELSLSATAQSFLADYQKPFLVGEYGTDWRGWTQSTVDPYLRGFRQGIWTPILSGAVGTAMSWWWENIDSENLYTYYHPIAKLVKGSPFIGAASQPIPFETVEELSALGDTLSGGQPFTVTMSLDTGWGDMVPGEMALSDTSRTALSTATFNSFVQGTAHPDLQTPFKMAAWIGTNAQIILHLNSVSDGSVMQVLVDGNVVYSWAIPNKDGQHIIDNEYNIDVPVSLPAGKHIVEIANGGYDWYYLDWVKLVNALPATYLGSPQAVGLTDGAGKALLYVVSPLASFPYNALNGSLPALPNPVLRMTNWPAGSYQAVWVNTITGLVVGKTSATTVNGVLTLPVASITDDLAGAITPN